MGGRMKRWLCCYCQTEDSKQANNYENEKFPKDRAESMFLYPLCLLLYENRALIAWISASVAPLIDSKLSFQKICINRLIPVFSYARSFSYPSL